MCSEVVRVWLSNRAERFDQCARIVQEIGFPYMAHPSHPPDTVFVFFEADFRFWARDCLETDEWLPRCADSQATGALRPVVNI